MKTETTFTTFLRTCKNWKEFASAEKEIQETGLSYQDAREACKEFNTNRTAAEREAGKMMEFTADENI